MIALIFGPDCINSGCCDNALRPLVGAAPLKIQAGHMRHNQREARTDGAGEETKDQPDNEADLIRRRIPEETSIRSPCLTKGRPERLLCGGSGWALAHDARAAGADSRLSIASITCFVEISFISWGGCLGTNSVTGAAWPARKITDGGPLGYASGKDWSGRKAPPAGFRSAPARCIGAESTVTSKRVRAINAAS